MEEDIKNKNMMFELIISSFNITILIILTLVFIFFLLKYIIGKGCIP